MGRRDTTGGKNWELKNVFELGHNKSKVDVKCAK
jgi:hypothetical protein